MDWRDNMSIGIPEQDKEMKAVFDKINEIMRYLGMSKQIGHTEDYVEELKDFFRQHFESQERMMLVHNYKNLFQHKYEHERFLKEIDKLAEALYVDEFSNGSAGLKTGIFQLLVKHICIYDKPFGIEYQQMKKKKVLDKQ